MRTQRLTSLSLAIGAVILALATGCSWSVGGSKTTTSAIPSEPTLGQELIDLKKAHEEGAISDEEYDQARARMLEQ